MRSNGQTASDAADTINKTTTTTTQTISRSISDAERILFNTSSNISRDIVTKVDEINVSVTQSVGEMTRLLDDRSNTMLTALTDKGEQLAGEVSRIADHAVKSIEIKSFAFTQTMMDNSEEVARLINDASENATTSVTRTLSQFQEGTKGVTEAAKTTIARTLEELHSATKSAIEQSKTRLPRPRLADMLETHGMLRTDSTALFERLREANILLQEVLSGAHENMNSIEHTMATRVSEFVTAMNDLTSRTGVTTDKVEQHIGSFNSVTANVLRDLGELATGVSTRTDVRSPRLLELLERTNRKADDSLSARHANIESLLGTLDGRTDDFEQRLRRFSSLLDESLDAPRPRVRREIASIIAETSNDSVQNIEQQFALVRTASENERKQTSEALRVGL